MPTVTAFDVAYVRFSAPDLDAMEEFAKDFGLKVAHRDADALYTRGLEGGGNGKEGGPYLVVYHKGPPKFIGLAIRLKEEADLAKLAASVPGCSPVQEIGGVEGKLGGGGKRVHFIDPVCGLRMEAVHGQSAPTLPSGVAPIVYNYNGTYDRKTLQDVGNRNPTDGVTKKGVGEEPGIPEVRRLSHIVIAAALGKHAQMMDFMKDTFGMQPSDSMAPGRDPSKIGAQFLHMDRGDDYSDHHSIFVLGAPKQPNGAAQLSHCSFELQSMDDVFKGYMHFRNKEEKEGKRYHHAWGIGRHILGGQVYDYWFDPIGHVMEHMCDTDRVNKSHVHTIHDPAKDGVGDQWGPTDKESGIRNLSGPQNSPWYKTFSAEDQASLVSRDLSVLQPVLSKL